MKIVKHFFKFLTIGILKEGSKIMLLQSNLPAQRRGFRLRPAWKNSSFLMIRIESLNIDTNHYKNKFSKFFDRQDSDGKYKNDI